MEWKLFKADKKRKKWSIRGTLFSGVTEKFPGHRDKKIAEEIRRSIERLNLAKAINEPPSSDVVSWLVNQPEKLVNLFVKKGLVDRRRLDRRLPLESFLPEFEQHLMTGIRKAGSLHHKVTAEKVRRFFRAVESINNFDDLTLAIVKREVPKLKVLKGLRKGQALSTKTVREYYSALIQFCNWMKDEGSAAVNPLEKLVLPSATENRVLNRHPLSRDEFNKLMTYLDTAGPYPHQQFNWTARDRAMLYWAAVVTGFRQNELLSLTRTHFNFDVSPATVTVRADDAKNGRTDTIPIPPDFAHAINKYTVNHLPITPVFIVPKTRQRITQRLYRDLDAAGVKRIHPNGDKVDFHTFRSTAICWWLRAGMNLLDVQFLSRLRSLKLIEEYVRRYLPDYGDLIKNVPKIAFPSLNERRSN